jgi:SAM-dependent methyltransferase
MKLTTISEFVAPPRLLAQTRMAEFADELRQNGYDLAACAKRLGVSPRLGVNFYPAFRGVWAPNSEDPVDSLLSLFIDGSRCAVEQLSKHFSSGFIDNALETTLLERDGSCLRSKLCLFPCYGKYMVTDRPDRNTGINQVMWLWPESFLLGGLVKRSPRGRAIDLGTGSGVHAILASDHSLEVVGVDINPRAIEFSRFNAALNSVTNAEFVLSDLFNSVNSTCDLLVANPPYAPDRAAKAGDNFWSGGIDGTEILRRIVEALPTRLDIGGTAHLNALFPNPPGTTVRERVDRWLGRAADSFEVLDHTWRVPRYEDLLSEQPVEGDKSAWRFGVVSFRRSASAHASWREVAGRGIFFQRDGSCSMVADHEAALAG